MAEKKKLTFEEKMEKLSNIVKEIDSGELDLDKSLALYDEAQKLIKDLSDTIEKAKEKINKVDN